MKNISQDETSLLDKLASGDRAAFESVYLRHNMAMVRFATAIVKSRATAEEVTQDAWVSILHKIGGFEGRSSLAGWMFTIVRNKARTRAARDGRTVSFNETGDDDGLVDAFDGTGRWKEIPELWEEITPERIASDKQLLGLVTAAIDALPTAQRAVIILRVQMGLDAREVATILDISEGNMRVLLHRARTALRKELDRHLA